MRDLLLFAVTFFCGLTALRKPAFGLLAYICFSFLAPYSMTWGAARTFPHIGLIAVCTLAGIVLSSEVKKFPRQREAFLLLALWGMFGISTLFAIYPDAALQHLILMSKILLMVFLTMVILNTKERLQLLVRVIALSLGFYGLKIGLFVLRTGGQGAVYGPDDSFLSANNSLGMALAMNVPLLFYLAKIESRPWVRHLMRLMAAFSYPAVVGTFSRGAWLTLASLTGLQALKSKHNVVAVVVVALVLFTAPVWAPMVFSEQVSSRYSTLENYEEDQSAQSRFWNWEFCARVGLARPITGGGFYLYSAESYEAFFPEFTQRWRDRVWSCHSMWLTAWAEHGIPGFLLWITLMASCLFSLRRIKVRAKAHADVAWAAPYADMIQAAFVGFMISGTFVDNAYFELYYFLIAATIILKEVTERPVASVPLVSVPRRPSPLQRASQASEQVIPPMPSR
jgi:probable O-glycosylation ligase (exosortase A-associated)